MDPLTSLIIPGLRRGLKQSSDTVKKGFISLLAHVVSVLGIPTRALNAGLSAASEGSNEGIVRFAIEHATSLPQAQSVWRQFDEAFHGDMAMLIHIDPDQDFFENINHMQLHRRVKAFGKLRTFLVSCAAAATATTSTASMTEGELNEDTETSRNNNKTATKKGTKSNNNSSSSTTTTNNNKNNSSVATCPLSLPTLVHVLLPLALHPLTSEDFKKKDHLSLLQESAAFIGAIALHLPWSAYLGIIKTLLKQLDRQKTEKEKVLLTALCAVLDAFHFDLTAEEEAVGTWKA